MKLQYMKCRLGFHTNIEQSSQETESKKLWYYCDTCNKRYRGISNPYILLSIQSFYDLFHLFSSKSHMDTFLQGFIEGIITGALSGIWIVLSMFIGNWIYFYFLK